MLAGFYDLEGLDVVKPLTKDRALFYSKIIYFFTAVVFAASILIYTFVEATFVQDTSVASTFSSGCSSLNKISTKTDVKSDIIGFANGGIYPGYCNRYYNHDYAEHYLSYNKLFSTYDDCASNYKVSCVSTPASYPGSSDEYDVLCNFLDSDDSIRLVTKSLLAQCISDISEINQAIMRQYTKEIICAPFDHNPPYLCTNKRPISHVEKISQSFALASAAMAILLTIAVTGLKYFAQDRPVQRAIGDKGYTVAPAAEVQLVAGPAEDKDKEGAV
jgi:hypothetical protein